MEWYTQCEASKILPRLYLGNIFDTADLTYNSNPLGVTAVLDVSTQESYEFNPDITYCRVPFPDGKEIPAEKFAQCMEFLQQQWDNGATILTNCAAGISRSTSIVVSFIHYAGLYKELKCGESLESILDYVRLRRPIVCPAPSVFRSCKQHLKLWPYDGTMGDKEPTIGMDKERFKRLLALHPNKRCAVRQSILENDDRERHLLICICRGEVSE